MPAPAAAGEVGLDFGVVATITPSAGAPIELSERIGWYERRRKRLQQGLSRKKKGSNNRRKALARVAECYRRIAAIRGDLLHQETTKLVSNNALIAIEDLAVKNMTACAAGTIEAPGRNMRQKAGLNRTILRNGWSMARSMLEYKGRLARRDAGGRAAGVHLAAVQLLRAHRGREPKDPGVVRMRRVRPRGERRSKCSAKHLAARERNHRAAPLREPNPGGRMPVKYRRICGNSCLFGRGYAPPETASSGSRKCCRTSVGRNRLGAGPLRESPCITCVASLRGEDVNRSEMSLRRRDRLAGEPREPQ